MCALLRKAFYYAPALASSDFAIPNTIYPKLRKRIVKSRYCHFTLNIWRVEAARSMPVMLTVRVQFKRSYECSKHARHDCCFIVRIRKV